MNAPSEKVLSMMAEIAAVLWIVVRSAMAGSSAKSHCCRPVKWPVTVILEPSIAKRGFPMSDNVHKKIELVGSSKKGVEDAIQNAITKASKSLEHLEWFEVQKVTGDIKDGEVDHYQVTLKVGFRLNR